MNITAYRHSEDFWKDHQAVILGHILEAELVYLNARNNIGAEQGFFGAAAQDGQNTLLAIQTSPYPMIFLAAGRKPRPLAEAMADYLITHGHVPAAFNGNLASTAVMREAFDKNGIAYRAGRHLLQRKCVELQDVPTLDLPLINANEVPYDFTGDYQCFLEECHAAYDPNKLQPDIKTMLQNNDLYVLLKDHAVVTMGRLQRKIPHARAVGVIYTPPRYRGHGYSTCCTKQLTRRIFADGYDYAYLYAEADNPISNHVYEKLGYQKTNDFIEYHLQP
ncbi:MAG TPA: GNAT family N-acetyltransferase [Candidatus Limiplasma sp.]|nr:GNAT family N-acetyltransferase [Candidatus Limiplasma sp.]